MKILKFVLIVPVLIMTYSSSVFAMTAEETICSNKSEKCQTACKALRENTLEKEFERDAKGNLINHNAAAAVNCL